MADYTEQRFDHTGGRTDAPELIVMVGISGSGKSVISKEWARKSCGKMVRFNRDDMRLMLYPGVPWSAKLENLVRNLETEGARMALQSGKDVVIDDTNCVRNTRYGWEKFAQTMRVKLRIVTVDPDVKVCIERDKKRGEVCPSCSRPNGVMVGEGVIRKQYKDLHDTKIVVREEINPVKLTRPYFERQQLLQGGFLPRLEGCPWVLVDVDGTLMHHGTRSPYDETRVLEDTPWTAVVNEVNRLSVTNNICVVSGRHDGCGDDTCDSLEMHGVVFDHILMRFSGDSRSDEIAKKEILDELVAVIGKESIAFVIDDRPRVIKMWQNNGIKVRQVYHGEFLENPTTKHDAECQLATTADKGFGRCACGALEYF